MPKLSVFACPSCGASLSVEEGAAKTTCQFCGNTVIVPEELRGPAPAPYAGPYAAPMAPNSAAGLPDLGKMKQMGAAVRAGNKIEAIKLYRELFGVGLADAKAAVERMQAGQPVMVNPLGAGMPTTVQMNAAALGSPYATASPPMIASSQPARRGACLPVMLGVIVAVALGFAALAAVALSTPNLAANLSAAVGQATNQYPRAVLSFGGEGTGAGRFSDPRSLAVGADGTIYVAEYTGGQVKVFDAAGKFVSQWLVSDKKDTIIRALAVDRKNTLYVVSGGDILRFAASTGKALGKLDYAEGWGFDDAVVTPGGGLVTTFYKGDDNIVIFDKQGQAGNTIKDAISAVSGQSELDMRVAVSGDGQIYALGTFNNAVYHFSPTGNFVDSFGSEGDQPGQIQAGAAIAVDPQGQVYISDIKGIQVFSSDGRYQSLIKPGDSGFAYGLAFDEAGALYFTTNTKKVFKYLLQAPAQ